MATVYDVFDNFLGAADCRRASQLNDSQWDQLVQELRRYYSAWESPSSVASTVFSGSWAAHNATDGSGRTILGNDLLLFERVVVHDPIEPYVSPHSVWRPPPGSPEIDGDKLPLALVDVPSGSSGRKPTVHTALFPPHVPVFMAVSEAHEFQRRSRTDTYVLRALGALEEWRDLVDIGALLLVPVIEVTQRRRAQIAVTGERSIRPVSDVLEEMGGEELTSFFSRGVAMTPDWQPPQATARARARHESWLYSREVAIAAETGALYAAEYDIDRELVIELVAHEPALRVNEQLGDATLVQLPGISDVPFTDITRLRKDAGAFHALRQIVSEVVSSDPTETAGLSCDSKMKRVADNLRDGIDAVRREAATGHVGLWKRFSPTLLTLGVPFAVTISGDHQALPAAGLTAGTALVAQWLGRRKAPDRDRALLWIERYLSPAGT